MRNIQTYVYSKGNDTFLTYFPFEESNTEKLRSVLVSYSYDQIINSKLQNMNQHPLSLELFEATFSVLNISSNTPNFEGVDVSIGQTLAKKLNFSIQPISRDGHYFGNILPNGSFTGALGRVSRRETDIAITGFFIKDYGTRELEFSSPIYSDELCVVVRKAKKIHPAEIPLLIFDLKLWIATLCVMILSATFLVVLRKFNITHEKLRQRSPLINVSMDAIKGFLSVPLSKLPTITNERLFFSFLIITSVVIVSMFQSNLANFYIKPLYYKDIDTLEQLDSQINQIVVKHRAILDDAFPPNVSQTMTNLRVKLKANESIDPVQFMIDLGHADSYKGLGGVTRRANTLIEEAVYFKTEQLHLVEECPRSYNLALILPKHSYLSEIVNDILLRIVSAGRYKGTLT